MEFCGVWFNLVFHRNASPTWMHASVQLKLDYRQEVVIGRASFAKVEELNYPKSQMEPAKMIEPGEKVRHKAMKHCHVWLENFFYRLFPPSKKILCKHKLYSICQWML